MFRKALVLLFLACMLKGVFSQRFFSASFLVQEPYFFYCVLQKISFQWEIWVDEIEWVLDRF